MTDIEANALALVNETCDRAYHHDDLNAVDEQELRDALIHTARKIEATEARHAAELREQAERFSAFQQEVSEAIQHYKADGEYKAYTALNRFILPAPDPLVEALKEADAPAVGNDGYEAMSERLRDALAARGLIITKAPTHD